MKASLCADSEKRRRFIYGKGACGCTVGVNRSVSRSITWIEKKIRLSTPRCITTTAATCLLCVTYMQELESDTLKYWCLILSTANVLFIRFVWTWRVSIAIVTKTLAKPKNMNGVNTRLGLLCRRVSTLLSFFPLDCLDRFIAENMKTYTRYTTPTASAEVARKRTFAARRPLQDTPPKLMRLAHLDGVFVARLCDVAHGG